MISMIGQFSLCAAVLVAAGAIPAAVGAIRFDSDAWHRATRWSVGVIALLFTIASAALLTALMKSDFRFEYVVSYTEHALPTGYKFAAFWAGQAGSLLLWAWLLGVLCTIAIVSYRRLRGPEYAVAAAAMAVICGFFAVLMLFVPEANPFTLVKGHVPPDGNGLNPMLQDPGMIIHPPLLFMGYAGYAIPFAVMIGVLAAGRSDNKWMPLIRPWLLLSWIFLTAGIVLGAWWAYVELGWGGYWAWDPVENASLLPWFTGTAALHSIIVQQHRGMFKIWNVSLIALTFILCIFGTYLTRSGVIQSVHAFPESWVGKTFLIFLMLCTAGSIGLFIWRYRELKPERELEGIISREGAFLFGNILLVLMMLVTLVGTIFPILSAPLSKIPNIESLPLIGEKLAGGPITAKREFYDKVIPPMALLLTFIMAHGPVLAFGRSAAGKIARSMVAPGVCALIVTGMTIVFGVRNLWAVACIFIIGLGTFAVIVAFARSVAARRENKGEDWMTAALRLIDKDHRRYGGQLVHLGVMMSILGIVGSSLFTQNELVTLQKGQPTELGRYTLTLESLEQVRGVNYTALEATVTLADAEGGRVTLRPQKRLYDKWRQQVNSEVDLRTSLTRDVYLILGGASGEGDSAAAGMEVRIMPLVLWIWLGGIVMCAGGLFGMLPRLLPQTMRAAATEEDVDLDPSVLEPVMREGSLKTETSP